MKIGQFVCAIVINEDNDDSFHKISDVFRRDFDAREELKLRLNLS